MFAPGSKSRIVGADEQRARTRCRNSLSSASSSMSAVFTMSHSSSWIPATMYSPITSYETLLASSWHSTHMQRSSTCSAPTPRSVTEINGAKLSTTNVSPSSIRRCVAKAEPASNITSSHSRKRSGRNRSARPGVSDSHNDSSRMSRICSGVVSAIRSPASRNPTWSISRFSTGGWSVRTNAGSAGLSVRVFSNRFDDWAFVSWRFCNWHGP